MSTRTISSATPADADPGFELDSSLGFLVGAVSRQMTARFSTALAQHDLTRSQWSVLARLWHEDELPQSELSRRTGIDPATLTGVLKRMERDGRLRRRRDPSDLRSQIVALEHSDPGAQRAVRESVARAAADVNAVALAGFTDAERTRLVELLGRALDNLQADAAAAEGGDTR